MKKFLDRWSAMDSSHKMFIGLAAIFALIALIMLIRAYWGVPVVYPSGEGG